MGPKAPSLLKSNRRKHFWVSTGRRAPRKVPQSHTKFTKQHMQINNSQYFSPQESENGQTAKKPSLLWYEKITALNQHQINPHTKTITRDIWTRETKAIRQQQSLPQKLLVHRGYFGLSLWLKPTKKNMPMVREALRASSLCESHMIQQTDWNSNTLTHQLCLISSKIHRKPKVSSRLKSGNIVPLRRYAYFSFQASLQKPHWPKFSSRNTELEVWPLLSKWSHLLFIKHISEASLGFRCNCVWFESTEVPIFSLHPFVLNQRRQQNLFLCCVRKKSNLYPHQSKTKKEAQGD